MTPLWRRVRSWLDLRPGEIARIGPLAGANGLILGSLSVLKPARDALFLDQIGVERLPYVLMLVAAFGGLAAAAFAKFSQTQRIDRLIWASYSVLIVTLVVFRLLLSSGAAWAFYAFYVWVGLYGLIAVALLWLYAGVSVDPREAARTFGLIGSGGIAGAIAGGLFTSILARPLGTENLLIVSAGLVAGALVLLHRVPIKSRDRRRPRRLKRSGLEVIRTSPLLLRLAAITALTAMISVFVDVQLNDVVARTFATRDEKTAFFGQFMAAMSAVAIVLQLTATPRLLQKRGAVFTFGLLPVGLALGSAAMLVAPGLTAAMLLKTSDGGLRYSVHKAAGETLFLPLPTDVKQRTKLILDAAVDALASGAGAALVFALRRGAGLDFVQLSWVSLGLIVPWLFLTVTLRRPYLDVFRRSLERREIDLSQLRNELSEAHAVQQLSASLELADERQLAYTLDLLLGARDPALAARLLPLLEHESAEIRVRALRVVTRLGRFGALEPIEKLLADPHPDVREEAVSFLLSRDQRRLGPFLNDPRPEVWMAALIWIGRNGTLEDRAVVPPEKIAQLLAASEGTETTIDRRWAAKTLGAIGDPELSARLYKLAANGPPELVQEAIAAAERSGEIAAFDWLLEQLGNPRHRRAARAAIVAIGEPVVEPLARALADASTPAAIRRQIPRVLASLPAQASVDALFSALEKVDPGARMVLFRALNQLRSERPGLRFDRKKVRAALRREAQIAGDLRLARAALSERRKRSAQRAERAKMGGAIHSRRDPRSADAALSLLARAAAEREGEAFERLFRALALTYEPDDILSAFQGLNSDLQPLRSSAVERLDHLLGGETRRLVWPLIEAEKSPAPRAELSEVITRLIDGDDPWLRACAMFAAADAGLADPKTLIARGLEDVDPRVRDAAEGLSRRMSGLAAC